MNKVAVFDVDDTIGQLRYKLVDIINDLTNMNFTIEDWDSHDLDTRYGIPFDQVLEFMVKENTLLELPLEPYTKEVLKHTKDQGYHIDILTARGWHPRGKETTLEWLKKHNLPHDDLTVVPLDKCKAEVLKNKYKKVHFTVDDNPKHCEAYAQSDVVDDVYVITRNWNKQINTDMERIKCLSELINKI